MNRLRACITRVKNSSQSFCQSAWHRLVSKMQSLESKRSRLPSEWLSQRWWILPLSIIILCLALLGFAQLFLIPLTKTVSSGNIVMSVSYPPIASTRDTNHFQVSVLNTSRIAVTPTVGLIYTNTQTTKIYTLTALTVEVEPIGTDDVVADNGHSSFADFPSLLPGERRTEEIVLRMNSNRFISHLLAEFDLFLDLGHGPKQPAMELDIPIAILNLWLPLGVTNILEPQSISWLWVPVFAIALLEMWKTILEIVDLRKELEGTADTQKTTAAIETQEE